MKVPAGEKTKLASLVAVNVEAWEPVSPQLSPLRPSIRIEGEQSFLSGPTSASLTVTVFMLPGEFVKCWMQGAVVVSHGLMIASPDGALIKFTARQLIARSSTGAACSFSEFLAMTVRVIGVAAAILPLSVNLRVPVALLNEVADASILERSDVTPVVVASATVTPDSPVMVTSLQESGHTSISMSLESVSVRVLSSQGYAEVTATVKVNVGLLTNRGLSHSRLILFDTTSGQTVLPKSMDT